MFVVVQGGKQREGQRLGSGGGKEKEMEKRWREGEGKNKKLYSF